MNSNRGTDYDGLMESLISALKRRESPEIQKKAP
jgi:hypothetical protein